MNMTSRKIHYYDNGKPLCGQKVVEPVLTTEKKEVTCHVCWRLVMRGVP